MKALAILLTVAAILAYVFRRRQPTATAELLPREPEPLRPSPAWLAGWMSGYGSPWTEPEDGIQGDAGLTMRLRG